MSKLYLNDKKKKTLKDGFTFQSSMVFGQRSIVGKKPVDKQCLRPYARDGAGSNWVKA